MSIRNIEDQNFQFNNLNINDLDANIVNANTVDTNSLSSVNISTGTIVSTGTATFDAAITNGNLQIGGGLRFDDGIHIRYTINGKSLLLGSFVYIDKGDTAVPQTYGGPDPASTWVSGSNISFVDDGLYYVQFRGDFNVPANTEVSILIGNSIASQANAYTIETFRNSGTYSVAGMVLYVTGTNTISIGIVSQDLGGGAAPSLSSGALSFTRIA